MPSLVKRMGVDVRSSHRRDKNPCPFNERNTNVQSRVSLGFRWMSFAVAIAS